MGIGRRLGFDLSPKRIWFETKEGTSQSYMLFAFARDFADAPREAVLYQNRPAVLLEFLGDFAASEHERPFDQARCLRFQLEFYRFGSSPDGTRESVYRLVRVWQPEEERPVLIRYPAMSGPPDRRAETP